MAKLSKSDYEYRRTDNSVSAINYHFVFVPKRCKRVLIKDVAHRLQEIIFELFTEHGWKLVALEVQQAREMIRDKLSEPLTTCFSMGLTDPSTEGKECCLKNKAESSTQRLAMSSTDNLNQDCALFLASAPESNLSKNRCRPRSFLYQCTHS